MYSNVEDTLLAYHSFAAHLSKSLSSVVSCYADSSPWKLQFRGGAGDDDKGKTPQKMSEEDLYTYNACDTRLTRICWTRMQPDLEQERHVYEHDKRLAIVCHNMTFAGIGVDRARKHELEKALESRGEELKSDLISLLGHDFNPGSWQQVQKAFRELGHEILSTGDEIIEPLATKYRDEPVGRFARALLRWRVAGKILSTYLKKVPINADTNRAHYNWKPFGTVSGRLAGRLQSVPRWSSKSPESRVREIYIPRIGHVFVSYDVKQAEPNIAANLSDDVNFLSACQGDVHSNGARMIFPDIAGPMTDEELKDPAKGKRYRDTYKGFGLAISYGAGEDKLLQSLVRKGIPITPRQVSAALRKLKKVYAKYFEWASGNVAQVRKVGHMRSPILGRIRWLGWSPSPTEVFNYPMQSATADIVNARILETAERLDKYPDMRAIQLVSQVHDAAYYDTPSALQTPMLDLISEVWGKPVRLGERDVILGIDLKCGERWSEL